MPFKKPHHTSDPSYVLKHDGVFDIKPRGLNIVWGNDSRYWKLDDDGGIAELIQVSWLEVSGQVTVEKGKQYVVEFTVKVKEDGFGWNGTRVLVMAKPGKNGKYQYKEVTLKPGGSATIPSDPLEISVRPDASDSTLYFGLYEVWSGKWKGGLQIIGAKVKPAEK